MLHAVNGKFHTVLGSDDVERGKIVVAVRVVSLSKLKQIVVVE